MSDDNIFSKLLYGQLSDGEFYINGENDNPIATTPINEPVIDPYIKFNVGGETILIMDEQGIIYKGERVKDAGEAYKAWVDACNRMGMSGGE